VATVKTFYAACYQVQVPATGRSLVWMSPTECGVSGYDREASTMGRFRFTRGCCAMAKKKIFFTCLFVMQFD
jgi:hypothetical protein